MVVSVEVCGKGGVCKGVERSASGIAWKVFQCQRGGRGRRCNVKLANCGLETSAQVLRSGHYYWFCMGYRQTER